jgi:hypothetical protein
VFSRRYDHQTGSETKPLPLPGHGAVPDMIRDPEGPEENGNISVVPSLARGSCAFLSIQAGRYALLFLDQIKPIEQLVPVS